MSQTNGLIQNLWETLSAGLQSLPWSAHAVVGLLMLTGLILWIAGQRLFKLGVVLLAAAVLATLGYFIPPLIGAGIDPILGAAFGLAIGTIAGFVLFRFAAGWSLGMVFATVTPLVVFTLLLTGTSQSINPIPSPLAQNALTMDQMLLPGVPIVEEPMAPGSSGSDAAFPGGQSEVQSRATDNEPGSVNSALDRTQRFLIDLGEELSPIWGQLPAGHRALGLSAAVVGGALGLIIGLMMPRKASMVVTALVGSAIWIPSAVWLLQAAGASMHAVLPDRLGVWMGLWLGISIVGVGIQWTGLPKAADKS